MVFEERCALHRYVGIAPRLCETLICHEHVPVTRCLLDLEYPGLKVHGSSKRWRHACLLRGTSDGLRVAASTIISKHNAGPDPRRSHRQPRGYTRYLVLRTPYRDQVGISSLTAISTCRRNSRASLLINKFQTILLMIVEDIVQAVSVKMVLGDRLFIKVASMCQSPETGLIDTDQKREMLIFRWRGGLSHRQDFTFCWCHSSLACRALPFRIISPSRD